jgi:hypothetical protein
MRKQQIGNIVWGLAFIAISVVGGVVLGGVVGKSLGMLMGGICWAIIGCVLLFQPATFAPDVSDDQYAVTATWSRLPAWAWVVVVVLALGGIASMIFLRGVRI